MFSYYLASKGLDVTTIDVNAMLVENANKVSEEMGWALKNHVMDINTFSFTQQFDHITSICVFEHIPLYQRIAMSKRIKNPKKTQPKRLIKKKRRKGQMPRTAESKGERAKRDAWTASKRRR